MTLTTVRSSCDDAHVTTTPRITSTTICHPDGVPTRFQPGDDAVWNGHHVTIGSVTVEASGTVRYSVFGDGVLEFGLLGRVLTTRQRIAIDQARAAEASK